MLVLGWNPGNNKEIFSLEELVEEFSLEEWEIRLKVRLSKNKMV